MFMKGARQVDDDDNKNMVEEGEPLKGRDNTPGSLPVSVRS